MESMTNQEKKNEAVRIAIIFLLLGLLLGGGFVLCVVDVVPIGAITLRLFSSLCVIGAICVAFVARHTLITLCDDLVPYNNKWRKKDGNPHISEV